MATDTTSLQNEINQGGTAPGSGIVTVTNSFTLSNAVTVPAGTAITLNSNPLSTLEAAGPDIRHIINNGNLTLANITLDGGGIGGGIHSNANSQLTINAGVVIQNILALQGGGINATNTVFTMNGGSIIDNVAENNAGGGLRLLNSTSTLNNGLISGNTVNSNRASTHYNSGGGIYLSGGTLTINAGITISNNTSTYTGGGIWTSNAEMEINGGDIAYNTATRGGGIYNSGTSVVNMFGGSINNNTSTEIGGGVLNGGSPVFYQYGGFIESNRSTNNGGGIYNGLPAGENNAAYYFLGGGIINNEAGYGGGVYNMRASSFYGPTTGIPSAGCSNSLARFPCDKSYSLPEGPIIAYNTATNGGGIGTAIQSNTIMTGFIGIYENSAGHGGGIYDQGGGILDVSNTELVGNIATTFGGGIYTTSLPELSTNNATYFCGNTANRPYYNTTSIPACAWSIGPNALTNYDIWFPNMSTANPIDPYEPATLSTQKSIISNGSVSPGSQLTYQVVVTNTSTTRASGFTLTDTLPTGLTFGRLQSVTSSQAPIDRLPQTIVGTPAPNQLTFTLPIAPTIQPGQSLTFTYTATVDDDAPLGQLSNSAVAQAPNGPVSLPGTSTVTISGSPRFAVSKSVDNQTPALGGFVNYTIKATNIGEALSRGVLLTDILPVGIDFVQLLFVDVDGSIGPATVDSSQNPILITVPGTIGPGAIVQATFLAQVQGDQALAGSTLTNSATATPQGIPDALPSPPGSIDIVPAALPYSVSKSVDNPIPQLGSTVTYTVIVSPNLIPSTQGKLLVDTLPAGVTFQGPVTANLNGADVSASVVTTLAGNQLRINVPIYIPANSNLTVKIPVTISSDPSLVGVAQVNRVVVIPNTVDDAPDLPPSPPATATLVPEAPAFTADKSVDNPSPALGSIINYTLIATHSARITASYGLVFLDTLPEGIAYLGPVTVEVNGEPIGDAEVADSDGLLTIALPDPIPVGATVTAVFPAQVTADPAFAGRSLTNSLTIVPNTPDGFEELPPSAPSTATVVPLSPHLSLHKSVSPANAQPGDMVTYTIAYINTGVVPATGFFVSDPLPTGSQSGLPMAYVPGSATVQGATGSLTDDFPNLYFDVPALGTATLTFQAQIPEDAVSGDSFQNIATGNLPNGISPIPSNPTEVHVLKPDGPNVVATKTVDEAAIAPGGILTYTITVQNTGDQPTQGFQVADQLSNGLTYIAGSAFVEGASSDLTDNYPIFAFEVAAHATATLTFEALVADDIANHQVLTNSASFQLANGTPPPPTPPTATTVLKSLLSATKTIEPRSADPGETVTVTIAVHNTNGTAPATGLTVHDPLQGGLTYVPSSAQLSGATSGLTGGYPDFTFDIPAGGTAILTFEATLPTDAVAGETFENIASFTTADGSTPPPPTIPAMVAIKPQPAPEPCPEPCPEPAPCPDPEPNPDCPPLNTAPIVTVPPLIPGQPLPINVDYVVPAPTNNLTISSELPPCTSFPIGRIATIMVNGHPLEIANTGSETHPEFYIEGPFNTGDLIHASFTVDTSPDCSPGEHLQIIVTVTDDSGNSTQSPPVEIPVNEADSLFAQYKCFVTVLGCSNLPLGITTQSGTSITREEGCTLKSPFTLAADATYQVDWSATFLSRQFSRLAKIGLSLDDHKLTASADCVKADPYLSVPMGGSQIITTGMFGGCLTLSNWTKCAVELEHIKLTITRID